ncbi:hypothetical protein [Rothia mucilaginosa]|uniref:hypothetical protein n=1 Tax=Rothia mucilaginosa TaxID=43675 RepID=UPI0026EABED9|nr:hypothetical protein [Rothia mucilaginosa]
MNCLGESSSYENKITLVGAAHTDQAANWYISRNASGARLVAPRSANPKSDRKASRYGFYLENKLADISIVAGSSRNGNILTQGNDRHLFFKSDPRAPWGNFYIDINFVINKTSESHDIVKSDKKDIII